MKYFVSTLLTIALLSSCASQQVATPSLKEVNRVKVNSISKVEVFYHEDIYSIIDLGGSGLSGLSGLFGPLGTLVGMTADSASKGTMKSRAETRSEEFTKYVLQDNTSSLSYDFANALADKLKAEGKQVKVTKINRPMGDNSLVLSTTSDITPTSDYARLILRITPGYGAQSATSSYQSLMLIETLLQDEYGGPISEYKVTKRNFSESYFTFAGLLSDHKKAFNDLKVGAISTTPSFYSGLFVTK